MNPPSASEDNWATSPASTASHTRRNRKRQQRLGGAKSSNAHAPLNENDATPPTAVTALGGSGTSGKGRSSPSPQQQQHHLDSAAAATATTGCQKKLIDLYDPDLTVVCINTLVSSLVYVPSHDRRERTQQPPFVLCREFVQVGSCAHNEECIFVHGSMSEASSSSGAAPKPIHANMKYATLDSARYPRLPPGETLNVMAPNGRPPGTQVASEFVFVTQGSLLRNDESRVASRKPLSHCAHYYFNRVCNRGANCSFIHVVCVADDDEAEEDDDDEFLAKGSSVLGMLAPPPANNQPSSAYHMPNVGDVPVIKISRASPIRKPLPATATTTASGTQHVDPQSQAFPHQQAQSSQNLLTLLVPTASDDRVQNSSFLQQGGITSPATSNDSGVFLDGAPPSLHGSFANSNPTPTLGAEDDPFNRGPTPGSSRPATPHRSDSFRSQPPKSPSLRSVTVGSKTLLFAPVTTQPKDKDGSSPAGSVDGGGGGEGVTTPVSFRHNPYGTPSSRNVTPTMD